MHQRNSGSFTLPGEAGYEDLTRNWQSGGESMLSVTATELSCPIRSYLQVITFIQQYALFVLITLGQKES